MQSEKKLIIDLAAAAARPPEDAIRDWAAEQRVFVSSVIDGYREYREAACAAIESVGAEPVLFERFGGRDSDPYQAYLSEVRGSTVYIGLLGARQGGRCSTASQPHTKNSAKQSRRVSASPSGPSAMWIARDPSSHSWTRFAFSRSLAPTVAPTNFEIIWPRGYARLPPRTSLHGSSLTGWSFVPARSRSAERASTCAPRSATSQSSPNSEA